MIARRVPYVAMLRQLRGRRSQFEEESELAVERNESHILADLCDQERRRFVTYISDLAYHSHIVDVAPVPHAATSAIVDKIAKAFHSIALANFFTWRIGRAERVSASQRDHGRCSALAPSPGSE